FLARSLDAHNLLVGAAVISGLQVGSVVATLTGHRLPSRIAIVTALVALGAGLWLLIVGVAAHAYLLIAVAVLVAGAGGGLAYTVGLNIIGAISPPDHRAETLSAFLVACYLGFSVPALGVGIAANWFGLSASFFGAAIVLGVIALSIIAFTTDRNLQVATNL
ncbi:MAG TPA: MFS transporter, partial [Candidatus Acidoferrales bacterium]|nr:MFS transporter [Candidatus Acidoferrales bacterium]